VAGYTGNKLTAGHCKQSYTMCVNTLHKS